MKKDMRKQCMHKTCFLHCFQTQCIFSYMITCEFMPVHNKEAPSGRRLTFEGVFRE